MRQLVSATPQAVDPVIVGRRSRAAQGVRADIQGLRAVAVSMVFVYHLWPQRFTGGFVGVDVFFVISGFLITSHLLAHPPRTATRPRHLLVPADPPPAPGRTTRPARRR